METICNSCRFFHPLRRLIRLPNCKSFICRACANVRQHRYQSDRFQKKILFEIAHDIGCSVAEDWNLAQFRCDGWPKAAYSATPLEIRAITQSYLRERLRYETAHDSTCCIGHKNKPLLK